MKTKAKSLGVQIATLIVVAILIIVALTVAPPAGLEPAGWSCLILVVCAFLLWLTGALPIPITCLLLIAGFYYLKVMTTKEIFAASCSNAVFFLLAGFGIGEALVQTNVAYIILRAIVKWAGRSSKKIIAGFVILTAIISLIVSNGTAAIIVAGIGVTVMTALGNPEPGSHKMLKGIMIGIIYGAMAGGLASPASNSLNVTITDLMTTSTGVEIGFLEWCKIGVPATILLTAFTAFILPKVINPDPLSDEDFARFQTIFDGIPDKLQAKDIKFLIIIGVLIVLWVSSNWVKSINVTMTAILGLAVMFLPGVNILTGKQYLKSVKPLGLILLLCIVPLATGMKNTGAGEWLVNLLFGGAMGAPKMVIYFLITLVALIIHLMVPSGSGNAALSATLMFPVAVQSGISCCAVLLILAMQCGNNFLMPIEGIYTYTMAYDHYTFGDVVKAGWPITLFEFVLCVLLIPALAAVFGMA